MLNKIFRRAYRLSGLPYRWSHTVEDYYPITPRSRWQKGRTPYTQLHGILEERRDVYSEFLVRIANNVDLLHSIDREPQNKVPHAPFWNNRWFSGLDAATLMNIIAWKRPARFIEIGSGHSTRFAHYAIKAKQYSTRITSVDPAPRSEINAICDRILRTPLESCDLSTFDELQADDVLFFDGSHRAFTGSDVTVFFFEILPRLMPGVIVHIHDIFIPNDYPGEWNRRLYNEQYLLAAMLMSNAPYRVLMPNVFVGQDPVFQKRLVDIFAGRNGTSDIPFLDHQTEARSVSFWMEKTSPGRGQ